MVDILLDYSLHGIDWKLSFVVHCVMQCSVSSVQKRLGMASPIDSLFRLGNVRFYRCLKPRSIESSKIESLCLTLATEAARKTWL